ncbi:MAG TPA: NADH-quinone oxidoreductase subunit K [Candidatus Dormibacteraeota bacterium]
MGLNLLLIASAALLAIGAFAVAARRSVLVSLAGAQFMLLAGAIAFVAFGRFGSGAANENGAAAMAMFAGASALAQLAVGLALIIALYREGRSFAIDADRG